MCYNKYRKREKGVIQMAEKILELIKQYGEANPTFIHLMGNVFHELNATYEQVVNAFEELYKFGKIEQIGDVNYIAI